MQSSESPNCMCMRRQFGVVLASALLAAFTGCDAAPRAAAVDATKARDALVTTLDGWKAGKKPEELQSGSPSITAQDLDWLAGSKLVSYRVVDEGRNDDANLRIPVELTLVGSDGRQQTKRVSYVVGTSPSVTVFREL